MVEKMNQKEWSNLPFKEKFTFIVNYLGINTFIYILPEDKQILKTALQADEHLNNIPLKSWDDLAPFVLEHLKSNNPFDSSTFFWCISYSVCTLKRAAEMWVEMEDKIV
jgi:hypothetical protein